MEKKTKTALVQMVKYGIVGVMNTIVTLSVIFICKSMLGFHPMFSNTVGYIAGFINSFLWNKTWVFKSKNKYGKELLKFATGFAVCYVFQFFVVYVLIYHTPLATKEWQLAEFVLSGYGVATIIGSIAYTMVNFFYNRSVTFSQKRG